MQLSGMSDRRMVLQAVLIRKFPYHEIVEIH